MIAVFSCSSPQVSVALLSTDGEVLACDDQLKSPNASGACLAMLQNLLRKTGRDLAEIDVFAADTGPGSFIGARIAVTTAKTLAYAQGKKCIGVSAFDLIDPSAIVVVPNRRSEWFVRRPGHPPELTRELPEEPWKGYGIDLPKADYPHALRASWAIDRLPVVDPEALIPTYIAEPSISTPKTPYREAPA